MLEVVLKRAVLYNALATTTLRYQAAREAGIAASDDARRIKQLSDELHSLPPVDTFAAGAAALPELQIALLELFLAETNASSAWMSAQYDEEGVPPTEKEREEMIRANQRLVDAIGGLRHAAENYVFPDESKRRRWLRLPFRRGGPSSSAPQTRPDLDKQ